MQLEFLSIVSNIHTKDKSNYKKKLIMIAFKLIILTLLVSFVPAAMAAYIASSDSNCTMTTYQALENRTKIPVNEWHTKMITRCPENYDNEEIIEKCEKLLTRVKSYDLDLYIPITNNVTNITYMNTYCASCNNNNNTNWSWFNWEWFKFTVNEQPCDNYTKEIQASEVSDLVKWTQIFIDDGMTLESKSNEYPAKQLQCSIGNKWPITLLYKVIPCLVSNYITGQHERLTPCRYFNNSGGSCTKMGFTLEGTSINYGESYKYYNHLSQINLTGGDYIVPTENDDVFYLCRQIYNPGYWGKFSLIIISIAFLLVYLILNFNKQYFQILPHQLLYIYSIGLIAMYVLLTYIHLKFPVSFIPFYLAKIFWTYHFLWTTLLFIVFCHLAFFTCDRYKNITQGAVHKIYLSISVIVGLVLPISLPIIYLNFLETHENQCPPIPGHLAVTDIPYKNLELFKFVLEASVWFFMPALIVAGILCLVINIPCDPDEDRFARYRINPPKVFIKMLSIVVIHYVLYRCCIGYYGNGNSYTVFGLSINMEKMAQLSFDIHGVLVFFVFLPDNRVINDILNKLGYKRRNKTTQGNNDGGVDATAQFLS